MTTGEAASLLRVSERSVRVACDAYEKNPADGIPFAWSEPDSVKRDVHGRLLRGIRQVNAAAVEAVAAELDRGAVRPGFTYAVAAAAAARQRG